MFGNNELSAAMLDAKQRRKAADATIVLAPANSAEASDAEIVARRADRDLIDYIRIESARESSGIDPAAPTRESLTRYNEVLSVPFPRGSFILTTERASVSAALQKFGAPPHAPW
jgi:hypothetical protein